MAPSCGLDDAELRLQLERYRQAGQDGSLIERTPERLVVQLDRHVSEELIERLLTVERSCCPFFTLAWARDQRQLSISVAAEEHEPALDLIAHALGHGASVSGVASD